MMLGVSAVFNGAALSAGLPGGLRGAHAPGFRSSKFFPEMLAENSPGSCGCLPLAIVTAISEKTRASFFPAGIFRLLRSRNRRSRSTSAAAHLSLAPGNDGTYVRMRSHTGQTAPNGPTQKTMTHEEFAVAFSLAGEQRGLIEPIAAGLRDRGHRVFYYGWPEFQARLATPISISN